MGFFFQISCEYLLEIQFVTQAVDLQDLHS